MSWEALYYVRPMTHAPNGEKLTSSEKLLMLMLAYHHDDATQEAWPSVKTLAEETAMSAQTVRRTRRGLVSKGIVAVRQNVRDNGAFSSSRYTFPDLNTTLSASPPTPSPSPHPPATVIPTTGIEMAVYPLKSIRRESSERETKEELKNREMDESPLSLKEIGLRKNYAEAQKRQR